MLVQTVNAVPDPYSDSDSGTYYAVNASGEEWSMVCDIGDVVDIRFCCEDEFGLGYDFLFASWCIEGENAENEVSHCYSEEASALKLYWPE